MEDLLMMATLNQEGQKELMEEVYIIWN